MEPKNTKRKKTSIEKDLESDKTRIRVFNEFLKKKETILKLARTFIDVEKSWQQIGELRIEAEKYKTKNKAIALCKKRLANALCEEAKAKYREGYIALQKIQINE